MLTDVKIDQFDGSTKLARTVTDQSLLRILDKCVPKAVTAQTVWRRIVFVEDEFAAQNEITLLSEWY